MIKIITGTNHDDFSLSPSALLHLIDKNSELVKFNQFKGTSEIDSYLANPGKPGMPDSHVRDSYYVTFDGTLYDKDKNKYVYLAGKPTNKFGGFDEMQFRTHPDLIEVFEKFGMYSGSRVCNLNMITIKDKDVNLEDIEIAYDSNGNEFVQEIHRVWEVDFGKNTLQNKAKRKP